MGKHHPEAASQLRAPSPCEPLNSSLPCRPMEAQEFFVFSAPTSHSLWDPRPGILLAPPQARRGPAGSRIPSRFGAKARTHPGASRESLPWVRCTHRATDTHTHRAHRQLQAHRHSHSFQSSGIAPPAPSPRPWAGAGDTARSAQPGAARSCLVRSRDGLRSWNGLGWTGP